TISFAAAMGALVNGLTQPFLGYFFDRLEGRRVILYSLIALGLVTVLLSLTFHILFLVFMFGFVSSLALSGASLNNTGALLARWFRRRRASVVGLNYAGTSLGSLLLVPFAMYLLQATHWRVTWVALGLIVLVLAVPLAFFFLRDNPSDLGLQPDGDAEPELPEEESANVASAPPQAGPLEADQWSETFRSLPIWQITGSYFVCGFTTFILSIHFVPYAIDIGVSPTTAATIFGFMMGVNIVGSIGSGVLSDWMGSRKNWLALVYFLRGTAYVLLLVTQFVAPGSLGLWIFAAVAGVSWLATNPLTVALTADVYGVRTLGTVSGVSFLFHQIGGFTSVLMAGLLYDLTGSYTLPFAIAGALLFPAALSAFTIKERKYSMRYQLPSATAPVSGN
ncbi:MAG: MFS transporter, partial [Dehalococcoidia bacterium]